MLKALGVMNPLHAAGDLLVSYCYQPDPRLAPLLADLARYVAIAKPTASKQKAAGRLMEQIAYLAFGGISGVSGLRSYRSAGPEYDLIAEGDGDDWLFFCEHLGVPVGRRDFLVECKARKVKITDPQMARLCAITSGPLGATIGVGVFFSLKPATGGGRFSLGAAILRQVLHRAATDVPIVVLELAEILQLSNSGSLSRLIRRKIRDLSQLCAMPSSPSQMPQEVPLPPHLAALAGQQVP